MTEASKRKTLYEILGVKPEATVAEIHAVYEELTRSDEDDTLPDPAQQLALKEAHNILSNQRRRAAYDKSLRQRERAAVVEIVEDDEPSGNRNKLMAAVAVVVLLIGAWWFLKSPGAATRVPAAPAARAVPAAPPEVSPTPALNPPVAAAPSRDKLLLGAWKCQGPLTGSGLALSFAPDGTYLGQSNGQPVRGDYAISSAALTLRDAEQSNSFALEELTAQRLVINRGEGKRLSCSR